MIHVYDETGNVIETHEHTGEFKGWRATSNQFVRNEMNPPNDDKLQVIASLLSEAEVVVRGLPFLPEVPDLSPNTLTSVEPLFSRVLTKK